MTEQEKKQKKNEKQINEFVKYSKRMEQLMFKEAGIENSEKIAEFEKKLRELFGANVDKVSLQATFKYIVKEMKNGKTQENAVTKTLSLKQFINRSFVVPGSISYFEITIKPKVKIGDLVLKTFSRKNPLLTYHVYVGNENEIDPKTIDDSDSDYRIIPQEDLGHMFIFDEEKQLNV